MTAASVNSPLPLAGGFVGGSGGPLPTVLFALPPAGRGFCHYALASSAALRPARRSTGLIVAGRALRSAGASAERRLCGRGFLGSRFGDCFGFGGRLFGRGFDGVGHDGLGLFVRTVGSAAAGLGFRLRSRRSGGGGLRLFGLGGLVGQLFGALDRPSRRACPCSGCCARRAHGRRRRRGSGRRGRSAARRRSANASRGRRRA